MKDADNEVEPMNGREISAAPAVIAKAVGFVIGVLTLAAILVEAGVWKGRVEAHIEQLTEQVGKFDGRMIAVELEAQASKQDREAAHREMDQFREDVNKRFDHQMERLNAIAEKVGAASAPRR